MTVRALVTVAAASLLLASGARAQRGQVQGSPASAVRGALEASWDRFNELAKAGKSGPMAGMYAEDASLMDPAGATITGRANIEKAMRDWFATARYFGRTRRQATLDVSGDLAVEAGNFSESFQERGKARVIREGRYLVVWRRVGDVWLVQRDVELPNPAAAKK